MSEKLFYEKFEYYHKDKNRLEIHWVEEEELKELKYWIYINNRVNFFKTQNVNSSLGLTYKATKDYFETGYQQEIMFGNNEKSYNFTDDYIFLMIDGLLVPGDSVVVRNDTALVPIRIVSERLGANVNWDKNTKKVLIKSSDSFIEIKIGDKNAFVNGSIVNLSQPAELINDSIFVPLRFISESLGTSVGYHSKKDGFFGNARQVLNVL